MYVVCTVGQYSGNEGCLVGFPGSGPSRGRDVDACLERAVHRLESSVGVTIEAPSQEGDEQTAELLPLNEPSAHRSEGFDLKDVFAVEESREAEAARPSQLAVRDDRLDSGSKSHRPGPRRADEHVESRADLRLATDPPDERVPLREPLEIRQDFPHAFDRRVDLNLGSKFSHRAS